uniref:Thioredoxin n=1 Tax=Pithovirus LCPAC101 TaxID=2506586 RepID=A0A481Z252_9VIRU|nr:MAG: thioredoxin [Pithovirus LCPAC101]
MSKDKSTVIHIKSNHQFRDLVEDSFRIPLIIDYYATWCGPCKKISPVFDNLSYNYGDHEDGSRLIKFARINVDKFEKISVDQDISSMPTFIIYKYGVQVERSEGASKTRLAKLILHHV